MSRVGSMPILLPSNISVSYNKNNEIEIKSQSQIKLVRLPKSLVLVIEDKLVRLEFIGGVNESTKDWGTYRQHLNNVIKGLVEGFSKKIFFVGTGYKAEVKGNIVRLYLGHSHSIHYSLPEGSKAVYDKATNSLTISANDKCMLGDIIKNFRQLRKVEPYKGKGVRVEGVNIIRKESKTKK